LTNLSKESFNGLSNVRNLTLDNNNLSVVTEDAFQYVKQLRHLDLKNNIITSRNVNLTSLPFLHTLKIDFIENISSSLLKGLTHLKNLDISGLSGRCKVKTLTSETFKYVPALEYVDISSCQINHIYPGTFTFMSNLSYLDVSFNTCLKYQGVENITYDLPYTSIKILKFNKVHKTFAMNTKIPQSMTKNLANTKLTELHLDSNRVQQVEKGAISYLPHTIRHIYSSNNPLSYGEYLSEMVRLPIEFINISILYRSRIPDNKKEEVCDEPDYFQQTITPITNSKLYVPPEILRVPVNLKTLIYRQSELHFEIPEYHVTENNSLEYVDLSFNFFTSWIGPMLYFKKLHYLDLSNNLCSNVSKVFFKSAPNLQTLNIQNNLLGFVLPDDVDGEIFQHVKSLQEINLAENRIPRLHTDFFKYNTKLIRLFIGGNMLNDITFHISHMTQLSYLELSNNIISSLGSKARDQLESIFKTSNNLTIDLSGNLLKCTCDTIDFIKWMSTTKIKYQKLSSYYCKLYNGNKQPLNDPNMVYRILTKQCSSYTTLIIGIVAVLLLFTSILTSGLVYRYRWNLRYMYYMAKNKYQRQTTVTRSEEGAYTYDAFISYEDEDRFFVHEDLLKMLEEESGFKLCIHKRDFLPGVDISENITSAIHNSRKVIVIMSHNYLDSYWCMFEYNMSRLESIYSRNKENILYLVFLEQLSAKDLPLIILELVQTQSYIEYPNDEYGNTVFWDKLRDALS
jgi:Leucine-rich repeat (LRR) protein